MPLVSATQMPKQGSWWSGSPAQAITTQRYTPGQQQSQNWARQLAQGQLSNNQFDFAPIEQAARTGFTSKTIPSIMERFTAFGGAGTAGSSALQGALGSAGAGLEEQLAAMKQQYNLAREPLLQNLLGMGMHQQFDTSYQPRQAGAWESPLSALFGGLGLMGGMGGGQAMFGGSGAAQKRNPWEGAQIDPETGAPYTPIDIAQKGSSSGSGWQTAGNALGLLAKLAPLFI